MCRSNVNNFHTVLQNLEMMLFECGQLLHQSQAFIATRYQTWCALFSIFSCASYLRTTTTSVFKTRSHTTIHLGCLHDILIHWSELDLKHSVLSQVLSQGQLTRSKRRLYPCTLNKKIIIIILSAKMFAWDWEEIRLSGFIRDQCNFLGSQQSILKKGKALFPPPLFFPYPLHLAVSSPLTYSQGAVIQRHSVEAATWIQTAGRATCSGYFITAWLSCAWLGPWCSCHSAVVSVKTEWL